MRTHKVGQAPGPGQVEQGDCPIVPSSHMLCLQRAQPLAECSWWCDKHPKSWALGLRQSPAPSTARPKCHNDAATLEGGPLLSPAKTLGLQFPASCAVPATLPVGEPVSRSSGSCSFPRLQRGAYCSPVYPCVQVGERSPWPLQSPGTGGRWSSQMKRESSAQGNEVSG